MRAEANVGLRRFSAALLEYGPLLGNPDGLSRSQLKFLAIRAGMAHLAFGDHLYRRARDNGNTLDEAKRQYEAARQVVEDAQISPDDPLHQQIIDYASQQQAKLKGGFNFLGYRDSYVPDLRLSTLADLVITRKKS